MNKETDDNKVLKSICALEIYKEHKKNYNNNIVFIVLVLAVYGATLTNTYVAVLLITGIIVYASLRILSAKKKMAYLQEKYKVN